MEENKLKDKKVVEEDFLVYLDFKSFLPFDELIDPETQIKIIGLETEKPIAQVNGRFFEGEYEFATGTKLFFTEGSKDCDSNWSDVTKDSKIVPFEYVTKTNKVLKMKRVFIVSKSEAEKVSEDQGIESTSKYEVTTSYSEVLEKFLPHNMEPPRQIMDEENGFDLIRRTVEGEIEEDDSNDSNVE